MQEKYILGSVLSFNCLINFSRNTVPLENTPKVQNVTVHVNGHEENNRKRNNLSVISEYEYSFFFSLTNPSPITEKIFDRPREYA
jgi:hypothetical protein